MCNMIFEVQGKTDDYVKIEKDGSGIEFLGERERTEKEKEKKLPWHSTKKAKVGKADIVSTSYG